MPVNEAWGGRDMRKDEQDLLEVLRLELDFLQKGGYQDSRRNSWGPHFIFEDSPTCINYDCKETPHPCSDCVLMQLVPPEHRSEKFPCRHIPLDSSGETLDSLYRYCDQKEVEERIGNWLRATIERLEGERRAFHQDGDKLSLASHEVTTGVPLYQKLHPKCANPACPSAFHWLAGGKFFRFRSAKDSATGHLSTHHYWLCERCSHVFTLVYEEEQGILLKIRYPELPIVKALGAGQ
jgi:hypothetical protein